MSVLTLQPGAAPADEEPPDTGERHRLTAVTGLAAVPADVSRVTDSHGRLPAGTDQGP